MATIPPIRPSLSLSPGTSLTIDDDAKKLLSDAGILNAAGTGFADDIKARAETALAARTARTARTATTPFSLKEAKQLALTIIGDNNPIPVAVLAAFFSPPDASNTSYTFCSASIIISPQRQLEFPIL